jgi:hypothetical protein
MAAAHLHYLEPSKDEYRQAELQHLSSAIPALRSNLGGTITRRNADTIFACSLLLYHHAWASVEQDDSGLAPAVNFGLHTMISLAHGLKSVFLEIVGSSSEIWEKIALYKPKISIIECAKHTVFPAQLEKQFEAQYQRLRRCQDKDAHHFETYMQECRRLVSVLSVLKLSRCGVDISPLRSDIVRYLFTFPMLFSSDFLLLMEQRDDTVQIVLAHFYAAVSGLILEPYWWTRQRAKYMLENIESVYISDALGSIEPNRESSGYDVFSDYNLPL